MAETKITPEQVKKIADLCRLELTDAEVIKFSTILTDTLNYITVLEELATENVPETFQVTGLENVYNQSDTKTTITKEEALANAKEKIKGLFATSAVFARE